MRRPDPTYRRALRQCDANSHSHDNAHPYRYCYTYSYRDGYTYGNSYRYIDAKREPNSYRHSYTETYSYSESSSVRSTSAHTAAETVAILTRATFLRSATGDKRSVLPALAPVREHAAISRPRRSRSRTFMSCVGAVAKKSRNSVDMLLPIQVEGCSTIATCGN